MFSGASDVDLQVDVSQELKSPHPNSLSQARSLSIDALLSHLDDCIVEQKPAGNNPSLPISEASSNELLEKITQQLLSDSHVAPASDEKRVMARVGSLLSLLQKDAVPANLPKFEPNDIGKIGVVEVGISSALDMGIANGTNPPGISRKDSYEELLSNLFNISEDFDD